MDQLDIEILADGTIKSTSGKVGGVNHQSAEAFLKMVATLAGGKSTRVSRGGVEHHHHGHGVGEHTHEH